MTVAPAAIQRLNTVLTGRTDKPKTYQMSGIVGDAQHSFGYHLSPNQLRANGQAGDYSLTLPRDRAGAAAHPDFASAWDLSFGPADMRLVTGRLIAAAKKRDARLMRAVREFAGTTNGTTVHPFDVASNFDDVNNSNEWDDSHLWHVHISFYRDVCNDYDALRGVLDVICGEPLEDDDMTPAQAKQLQRIFEAVGGATDFPALLAHGDKKRPDFNSLDAIAKRLDAIEKKLEITQ